MKQELIEVSYHLTHGQPGYSKNKNAASEKNMNHKNFDASSLVVADLDWRWHEAALRLGCVMSINPDAHSTREIDLTHWGVEMARKGGLPKDRVLNCLGKDELSDYLKRRRARRRTKAASRAAACSGHPASSSAPKQADARKPRESARR